VTTRTPLVVVTGQTQQMPAGDTVPLAAGGTGATTAGAALTALGAVPSARTLTVAAPLTGGGNLSADRTLGLSYDTTLQVSGGALGISSLVALLGTAQTFTAAQVLSVSGVTPLDIRGLSDDTGRITLRLSSAASGAGTFIQFTDTATYNAALGASGVGDLAFYDTRYPGNLGTLRFGVGRTTGTATITGGLNVGTATGATAGGIKAGDSIVSGSHVFATNGGFHIATSWAATIAMIPGIYESRIESFNAAWNALQPLTYRASSHQFIGGPLTVINGDIMAYRTGGTTGVIYLDSIGAHYLYYDGEKYQLASAALHINGSLALTSDERRKTAIAPLTHALATLLAIPARQWRWKTEPDGPTRYGPIAQETERVAPELVMECGPGPDEVLIPGERGYLSLDSGSLIGLLHGAIHELAARVAALEAR